MPMSKSLFLAPAGSGMTEYGINLARQAAAPETSPRVRYPAWPSLGLGDRMSVLESAMTLRLQALITALDARALEPGAEDAT